MPHVSRATASESRGGQSSIVTQKPDDLTFQVLRGYSLHLGQRSRRIKRATSWTTELDIREVPYENIGAVPGESSLIETTSQPSGVRRFTIVTERNRHREGRSMSGRELQLTRRGCRLEVQIAMQENTKWGISQRATHPGDNVGEGRGRSRKAKNMCRLSG